jgi:urease accessory protein
MLTLTTRLPADPTAQVQGVLSLTAAERCRSRHRYPTRTGVMVSLHLPRGTVLQPGDLLASEPMPDGSRELIGVEAEAEPVLTVTAAEPLDLLRAAYHLGNRHVPLEVTATYLRLSPDPVLQDLLLHLGLQVVEDVSPFFPEGGAYHTSSSHGHSHGDGQTRSEQ